MWVFPRFISLRALLAAAALALPFSSPLDAAAQSVKAAHAWVRAPVGGQKTVSAYVELTSEREAALVAAASPAAGRVEMHTMSMDAGVMRMRAVSRIDLPAGQTVKLAPGGVHLMLFDLKRPLKAGEKVPLMLSMQAAGAASGAALTTLEIQAEVRPMAPAAREHHHH